jgi:hypothetical protein
VEVNPLLAQIAQQVNLKTTPEGAQKAEAAANLYGEAVAQQAVQNTLNPDAIDRAVQQRKQAIFQRGQITG